MRYSREHLARLGLHQVAAHEALQLHLGQKVRLEVGELLEARGGGGGAQLLHAVPG